MSSAVRRSREPERPAAREPLDGLDGAGQQRQPLAVARLHAADDFGVDLLRRLREPELLVHVARPFERAHPHHVALRPVVPAAAALPRELLPFRVPDLLRVQEQPIQVEDDGVDHSER